MIHLVTSREEEYKNSSEFSSRDIKFSTGLEFKSWMKDRKIIQLDTETNVVDRLMKRELYVVQVGDRDGKDQWIFDMIGLKSIKLNVLKECLADRTIQKLIHNSSFEYTIIKKEFGIDIDNIQDTMLVSRILFTGLTMPKGFHGLAGCVRRYLNIEISKAEQTSFSKEPMTIDQIVYAATDVTLLGILNDRMMEDIVKWDLENTVKLENAVVRPLADGCLFNFYLNKEKWRENMKENEAELSRVLEELHETMRTVMGEECENLGFIQKQDAYAFSWGSSKMKNRLMKLVYPELPTDCTTLPVFKKFYKELESSAVLAGGEDHSYNLDPLEFYLNRDFENLERYFITNHHADLVEMGLFTPKGTVLINFASPAQTLKLFQLINPNITDTNKETINKINHPLAKAFRKYSKAHKLATSYGQNYIDACDEDGMLRLHDFNQILETGRTSLKLYQLLPGDNKYRNCFYAPPGWKVVGFDYASQEFVIAACLSGETKMIEAIRNRWDPHSISASLMFPKEWAACGEDPNPTGKPKTKEGEKFRSNSKKTSFGIMYGKSAQGLAEDLDLFIGLDDLMEFYEKEVEELLVTKRDEYKIFRDSFFGGKDNKKTRKEFIRGQRLLGNFMPEEITGDDLVQRFKNAFPKLNSYLESGAESTTVRLHIRTQDPVGRLRFFEPYDTEYERRAIFRAAMNMPIQGTAANMTKYAIARMKRYWEDNGLSDVIKFGLGIHDEALTFAREDYADAWYEKMGEIMEEAGTFILDNDLQKAEGKITDLWEK
jgi:DNA polymerase I-like protein with 3'-5' exonuclease and polymerase domains